MDLNYSFSSSFKGDYNDYTSSGSYNFDNVISSLPPQTSGIENSNGSTYMDLHNSYPPLNNYNTPEFNNYRSCNLSPDSTNPYMFTNSQSDKIINTYSNGQKYQQQQHPTYNVSNEVYSNTYNYENYECKIRLNSLYNTDHLYNRHKNFNTDSSYKPLHQQHNLQHYSISDNNKSVETPSYNKSIPQIHTFFDSKKPVFLKILTTQVVSGTIIGRRGKGLNWFRRKSRVDDIHLSMPWEVYPRTEYRTILLKGTIKSIIKAVMMISDLMTLKSKSEFWPQSNSSYVLVLIVCPDILLPKILELKSTYNPRFVSIVQYKEPDFNEIVVSVKGERLCLRNIIAYLTYLIYQVIDVTNYCFITYKLNKSSILNSSCNNNFDNESQDLPHHDTINFLSAHDTTPNSEDTNKDKPSNLNLTLNDLAPDDLTPSGTADDYLRAIDNAIGKFTPPSLKCNDYTSDSLNETNLHNSGIHVGNELFNTTICHSSSPFLDLNYTINTPEISRYPATLTLILPQNFDFDTVLKDCPSVIKFDVSKNDTGQSICSLSGPFHDIFNKGAAIIWALINIQ